MTFRAVSNESASAADAAGAGPAAIAEPGLGESRWPPAVALTLFLVLNVAAKIWLGSGSPVSVPWLVPSVEAVLLFALVAGDLGNVARPRKLHRIAVGLVCVLVVAALWATVLLLRDLIRGTGVAHAPTKLLAAGALVWLGNNLSFGLLYWLIDSGGPRARALRNAPPIDFAFTQQMSPELGASGWRPVFLDYLHLGFTNATAFSPTDVMPLTHRAKYAMLVQSTTALAIVGLVVARAVNAFT